MTRSRTGSGVARIPRRRVSVPEFVSPALIATWRENLEEELDAIVLYDGLAVLETDITRARIFHDLSASEKHHAAVWERKLTAVGQPVLPRAPSVRIRTILWFARHVGVRAVLPIVVESERTGSARYAAQGGDAAALVDDEKSHHDTLRRMQSEGPTRAMPGGVAEKLHIGTGRGGSVRAAVFGVNDGVVSNVALVLGVAASGAEPRTVVVAGVAGLLAGALSMASGEYISVASQRDLMRRQVELEAAEMAAAPEEEEAELVAIYERKGFSRAEARRTARTLMRNPAAALDTLVREELGLDPTDLGSPLGAAIPSFFSFAGGAIVPLVPFLFASGLPAAALASSISALTLGSVGALLGFLSGTGALRSALRVVALATVAAAVTVVIGRLLGTALN